LVLDDKDALRSWIGFWHGGCFGKWTIGGAPKNVHGGGSDDARVKNSRRIGSPQKR
jgi:hypothetical protein